MMIWGGIFGLVVVVSGSGLLLSARLLSRRPDLARVGIEGGYLVVRLPWMATLAAFGRNTTTGAVVRESVDEYSYLSSRDLLAG